ncbi:MAG: hypothetical protein AB7L66_19100 [Gemmatimonadales bacterium]
MLARSFVRSLLAAVVAALPLSRAAGQELRWSNRVTVYGDNTEFFTPYRVGETLLGGQFHSVLEAVHDGRYAVTVGVFGDVRWGSSEFLDRVRPILGFQYRTATSTGVIGSLITERRHGFLDALAVSTQELTRPVEYGLQWIERRSWLDGELFINWQALNTATQREVFDFGGVARIRPVRQISFEGQWHGLHHGGQLYSAGVPVTNNAASAVGVVVADTVGRFGRASFGVYRLHSAGNIDPDAPPERPRSGRGTLIRAALEPAAGLEVFALRFRGRDFLSQEGDNNYNSVGHDPAIYRAERKYFEVGVVRRGRLPGGVELDAEFRFHRIDDEPSIAIEGTSWEYSYRLVIRTPISVLVRAGERPAP